MDDLINLIKNSLVILGIYALALLTSLLFSGKTLINYVTDTSILHYQWLLWVSLGIWMVGDIIIRLINNNNNK